MSTPAAPVVPSHVDEREGVEERSIVQKRQPENAASDGGRRRAQRRWRLVKGDKLHERIREL